MSIARVDNFGPSAGGTTRSLRGIAAAFANLDGTGTIALRDSQNVSSVVDNGTGDYTFNLSSAMANTNYSTFAQADASDAIIGSPQRAVLHTASAYKSRSFNGSFANTDTASMDTIAMGDLA